MANNSNVITLGPFAGGLNNYQDASSIGDQELSQVVNYEVEPGGNLITRPGITINPAGITWGTGGGANASLLPNGTPVNPIAVGRHKQQGGAAVLYKEIDGKLYFERMNNAADAIATGLSEVTGLVPGRKHNTCAVQYNERMYFSNQSSRDGVGYTRIGFTDSTKIPTMPLAENLFVHKERIFAVPGKHTSAATGSSLNRIYYSPVLYNGGNWNIAENFINIGGGDGEFIVNGIVYLGDILFFKDSSTWRFTYEADIAGGTLEKINASVGSVGSRSVTMCNDRCYTFYNDNLYEIFNYQWRKLSGGIKFNKAEKRPTDSYAEDVSLGHLGDRVIVSYYGNTYVYSQNTGTWSMWESSVGGFGRMLNVSGAFLDNIDNEILIAGHYKNTNYKANTSENKYITKLYRVEDSNQPISTVNTTNLEAEEKYECRFTTKVIDLGAGSAFKRLMWWGIDSLIKTKVQSTATVIVNNAGYTWDDLTEVNLDALEETTCDNLITVFPRAVNNIDMYSIDLGRRFIKFLQGLRFRQIQLDFNTTVDGTADTVPHKVYTITMVIKGKTKMSEQVS